MTKIIVTAAVAVIVASSIGMGVLWEKRAAKKQRLDEVDKLQNRVEKVKAFLASVKEETEGTKKCRKDLADAVIYMKDYVNDVRVGAFFYSVALGHLESAEDYCLEVVPVPGATVE